MTTTIAPGLGHAPMFTQGGVGATPGYDAVDFRRALSDPLQEGVLASGDWMVTQRGAGANASVDIAANLGIAYVLGDSVTLQGLYPVAPHTAVINEAIAANGTGNPRIDSVILEIQDNAHDASGANLARIRVLTGTATLGATLDNRTGAVALPASSLLLADILCTAGFATITNANIRDRRKWARGAYCRIVRNSNAAAGNDYTLTNGGTLALLDSTNLAPRIECSGVPTRVQLIGTLIGASGTTVFFSPQVDSAGVDGMESVGATPATGSDLAHTAGSTQEVVVWEWTFVPSAGSHKIAPAVACIITSTFLRARASGPVAWIVEEIFKQNTANNTTTTG